MNGSMILLILLVLILAGAVYLAPISTLGLKPERRDRAGVLRDEQDLTKLGKGR